MLDDFLTINPDQASAIESNVNGNTKQVDHNLWKPTIGKDIKEYEARIRLLPQGINGLKNKLPAYISYKMHYLKDPKHKIYKSVQCRGTIGGECPVCKAAWAIFNAGKEKNNKALMDLGKSRLATTRHVINILVKDDLTNPSNNNKVLKWDHTDHINNTLMDPLRDDEVKLGEAKPKFKKSKEKFTPYSPRNGRDRFVIVERNPSNDMPTYDNSYWDELPSDLASSSDEMMAILDQCHDLSSYINVPTSEELMTQYNEFINLVDSKDRNDLVSDIQTSRSDSTGNILAPRKQTISNGDAGSYFERPSTPVDILNINDEVSQSDPLSSISDNEEDDLPF